MARKKYWNEIYRTKKNIQFSWYQEFPKNSLELIQRVTKDRNDSIIDIGGGDSFLVDKLLFLGYTNVTVLDISENAINKVKTRLGEDAKKVTWIVSDIIQFTPSKHYDIWHDRAVFHFLNEDADIEQYKILVNNSVNNDGHFILSTFSEDGPDKCSGLPIKKYSSNDQQQIFKKNFQSVETFKHAHLTPFESIQQFTFSLFKKC